MSTIFPAINKRRTRRDWFTTLLVLVVIAIVLLLSACSGQADSSPDASSQPAVLPGNTQVSAGNTPASVVSFSKDVLPILQSRCVKCHGGQKTEKGLNMTSYEKLMAGSEKGAVVIAGDVDQSRLIQLILQGKMPKNGPRLLPAQVQVLIDWVKAGALNS